MRNIEKYKDNIEKHINVCGLYREIYKIKNGEYAHDCCDSCDECYDDCIRWLAEEFKEPVLDDVEKEYLSAVIKPFREKVSYISKLEKAYPETDQFIKITLINGDCVCLPYFTRKSRMHIGMKQWRHYTLQELGL